MSYPIRKSDGTLIVDLQAGTTDVSKTSLALVGKNASDYGLSQNENFVKLLENFANGSSPQNAVIGQIWFDTSAQQLKVLTSSGYQPIGPFAAPPTPVVTDISTTLATTQFVHNLFPKGIILMWSGTLDTIPTGWALCNGQVISGFTTPDLTKKFIMGAGPSYLGQAIPGYTSYTPGTTGGKTSITDVPTHTHGYVGTTGFNNVQHTHTGSSERVPDHTHIFPGDDQLSYARDYAGWPGVSAGSFPYDARSSYGGGAQMWKTTAAGGFGSLALNISPSTDQHLHEVSGVTNPTGSASVDITNPFYALAFIVKVI